MTAAEFREKHPKIFNQIVERAGHAERVRVMLERIKAKNPNDGTPFKFGDAKHKNLIASEIPLLA
jgi:hypothetical protein